MNTSHAKAIKGMSIANIVLGALGILGTLIIWMGLGAGGADGQGHVGAGVAVGDGKHVQIIDFLLLQGNGGGAVENHFLELDSVD